MESLLRVIVHENTNLRARLKGLEIQNEKQNTPVAVEEVVIPPVHHHAFSSALKHARLRKPLVTQMPTVHTSKRQDNVKHRPNDAPHHPEVAVIAKS